MASACRRSWREWGAGRGATPGGVKRGSGFWKVSRALDPFRGFCPGLSSCPRPGSEEQYRRKGWDRFPPLSPAGVQTSGIFPPSLEDETRLDVSCLRPHLPCLTSPLTPALTADSNWVIPIAAVPAGPVGFGSFAPGDSRVLMALEQAAEQDF